MPKPRKFSPEIKMIEKLSRRPHSTASGVVRLGMTCRRITVRGGTPHSATALTKSRSQTSCAAACIDARDLRSLATRHGEDQQPGLGADHADDQQHEDQLRDGEHDVDDCA